MPNPDPDVAVELWFSAETNDYGWVVQRMGCDDAYMTMTLLEKRTVQARLSRNTTIGRGQEAQGVCAVRSVASVEHSWQ